MNKIYKVIWSKTRNCYVAVSEIAKRNGKSCTSVNCEGKANRSRGLRMAALTLSVAAALVGGVGFGTPAAWADGSITISDANNPMSTATGGTVTSSSGYVHPVDSSINELNVVGGKTGNYYFASYYSYSASGTVSGYTLNISGSDTQIGMGQYSGQTDGVYIGNGSCTASGNKVNVTGGAVAIGEMAGAKIKYGTAQGNEVTINNSMANHTVIGGYFTSSGVAIGNTVTVSGIKEGKSYTVAKVVYGGGGKSGTAGVKVVDGNEVPDGNKVIIKGSSTVIGDGTSNGGYVYGGSVDEGSGAVKYNSVEIEGSTVKSGIYGGYTGGSGSASNNKVTISGGTVSGISYGGYSNYGSANENKVEISGNSVAGSVYGGATYYSSGVDQTADGNQVTISGSSIVESVIGGFSYGTGVNSHANSNTVTLSGGVTVKGRIQAGSSYRSSALNNHIIIKTENDTDKITVQGNTGLSVVAGDAGYTSSSGQYVYGDATGNSVDISGNVSVTITDDDYWNNTISISAGTDAGNATDNRITININDGDSNGIGNLSDPEASARHTITAGQGQVATGNTVDIKKGKINVYRIIGGSASGSAKDNHVKVAGMSSDEGGEYRGTIIGGQGGSDKNDEVSGNSVEITGGKLAYSLRGGSTENGSGKITGNRVDVSGEGTALITSEIYGGYGSNEVSDNHVTISDGAAINADKGYGAEIIGGRSGKGIAKSNTVTIEGEKTVVRGKIYGGISSSANSAGNVVENIVTINGATLQSYSETYFHDLAGGYSGYSKNVSDNKVNINGGNVSSNIYGGYGERAGAKRWSETEEETKQGKVSGNVVTITDGTLTGKYIIGGFTQSSYYYKAGDVKDNIINVSGGTVKGSIFGGVARWDGGGSQTESEGIVSGNKVNISGTAEAKTKVSDVYGGYTGPATGYVGVITEITENSVTLSDNASAGSIYGGYADVSSGKDNVHTNTVTISGGTVNGYVYGGYSSKGSATSNIVKITGGTVKASILGGGGIVATGNKVEISGTETVIEIDGYVYGGNTFSGSDGSATGNTVTLGGVTVSGTVYGGIAPYYNGSDVVTGNTLVLSKSNNTIAGIKNFETIKLADTLAWSDGATVLKANNFEYNVGGTRAALDITDAENNLKNATSGQMTLLASEKANDFKTLSLIYSGSDIPVTLNEEKPSKELQSGAETTETTPVKGVTLTYASTQMVSLDADNSYKNVLYKVENIPSKITLGTMTWGMGRDLAGAYSFGDTATIDGSNLFFTGTVATALKKNDDMMLVSNAKGISSIPAANITQPGDGKGTVAVEYTDSNNIKFNATASGNVTADTNAVKYTVSSVTADKITLASQAWGTTAALPDSSWTASASTAVDATNFTYTGEATTALKVDEVGATILNAQGLTTDSPVTAGTDKTVGVNYTDDAGVTYTATASGHVAAAKDAVNYVVDGVAATGVNLQNWNGTDTSTAITTNGWIGTDVAVETGSFAAPTDLNLGETRTIATAPKGFFGTVTGTNAFPSNGGTLSEDTGGVKLAGSMIGGVKAEDDGITATLTYYAMKKTADTMTLGTFAFVDGDANARTYGKEYDLTNAEITTGGLAFTEDSKKAMEAGNKMTLVDASGAYKNGGAALKVLSSGAKTSFDVEFSDASVAVTEQSNISVTGKHTDTLAMVDSQKLEYTVGNKVVDTAKLDGTIAWVNNGTHYTNTKYTFDGNSKVDIDAPKGGASGLQFTSATDPLNQSMTLIQNASGLVSTNVSGTPDFTVALNNTTLEATATGAATVDSGNLKYTVNSVTLNQVNVAAVGSDAVPTGWSAATSVTVDTENMTVPAESTYGSPQNILTADSAIFTDDNITGKNKYGATPAAFADTDNAGTPAVTIAGQRDQGVKASADGKSLVYEVGTKEASSVTLGSMQWASGTEVMDGSSVEYDYKSVTSLGTDGFAMAFEAPETMDAGKGESMTLLKANATLADMSEQVKKTAYSYNPVSGVTVDAAITGKLTTSGGAVTYTPMANQASKLTFTSVDWKDSGALMTRPANITFAGADVDTAKINFHNIQELAANSRMTLVSDFGETVGTITGDTFTVGSGLKGEGAASLSGTDLIFTAKTAAESLAPTEATHETVMAMEAGTAVVAAGREYVDSAVEGLGLVSNMAPDGTSTFASMGGGVGRYKTGSHVDTHTWSAVVAVGSKREHKKGDLEWGVFAEYGRGNYTLHDDNGGRGDGNTHYAGGGLLAKWTNKHDVYTEASFRMGRMSDSASNMLRDVLGNTYGYDVHANYFGGHVGLGKIYKVKGNKDLDVYGKFFYTRRNGVDFDAGGNHYSLDSVASKLLRIGARYGSNDRKWNWYGGLAYEYEFGGESRGTVDGLAIRSASIKGASVRGEIGVRLEATKTNPWKADISIYGYGGKHRGIGGTVSVAYMF